MLSLGIDIGGTKILGAAVSPTGEVVAEHRVPSPAQQPDQMVDTVSKLILDLIAENGEPEAIGVAAAGFINRSQSVVLYAPNLNWRNEPLRERIEKKINRPLIIENDANAAGWAEFKFGAAQKYDSMVMLTLVIHVVPPAPFWQDQDAFARLLGQGARMQFAGLISYGTSQTLNVYLFSRIAGGQGKALVLRAWIASLLSQIVDTILFITISFYGQDMPLGQIMEGQIISKLVLSTIMVPPLIVVFVKLGRWLDRA